MARNRTQHAGDRPSDPNGVTRAAMQDRALANARAGRIDRAPRVAPSSSRLPFIPVKPRRTAGRQAHNAGVGTGVGGGRQVTLDNTAPSVANVDTTQVRSLTAYCAQSEAPQVRNQVPAQPVNGPAAPNGQGQDVTAHPAVPRGDGTASEQVKPQNLPLFFPNPPLYARPNPNFGSITTNTNRAKPINMINKPVKKRVKKQVDKQADNQANNQANKQADKPLDKPLDKPFDNHGNNYRGNDVVKRAFSNPRMRAIFSDKPGPRPRKAGNQPNIKVGVRQTYPGEIVPEDTDEDNDKKENQQNKRDEPSLPPRNPRS